jgi:hypothetical protein
MLSHLLLLFLQLVVQNQYAQLTDGKFLWVNLIMV